MMWLCVSHCLSTASAFYLRRCCTKTLMHRIGARLPLFKLQQSSLLFGSSARHTHLLCEDMFV